MKSLFEIAIILLFVSLFSGLAEAANDGSQRCDQRGAVLKYLSKIYAEKPIAMGVAENGRLIEVLTSRDGLTFTIIVTSPNGETWMVAAGQDWQGLLRKPTPKI